MSYILEALKKAQAERQLGALPTIHAPAPPSGAPDGDGAMRRPIALALAACGLLILLAAAVWFWRQPEPGAIAVTQTTTPAAAEPVRPTAAAAAPAPVPVPVPAVVAAPTPAPAPLHAPARAPISKAAVPPAKVVAPPPASPARTGKSAAPDVAPNPAGAEESVAGVRDLPEPIQRQIPALALGGYIYSRDPAERILLVDKVLRHEGEEVAPGVTLEKLQAKAAIFSFKGYRYRVPY